jgi:16S rRNA (cytosine1402-N4)-methyltransferase
LLEKPPDLAPAHRRRPRYSGRNPRAFREKYKELDPARYPSDVEKVLAAGKTPAGTHRPIMVDEVLRCLRPAPGDVAVDCTLGGGGHARAVLERVQPGGRLIGLDLDPLELPRTEASLRAAGFGPGTFSAHRANFAALPRVLAAEGVAAADLVLADLGVSSMQLDNPERGFNYKEPGPLDMRMNPSRGEPASQLLARVSEEQLAALLRENADEPHAEVIASLVKRQPIATTHALENLVRTGLTSAYGDLAKSDVKMSVRRTFQAIRIAVNDELSALDSLLRLLPACLAPGGRVAILTFHSGEDRRVKKAFQSGVRAGIYASVATEVIRSSMEETRANRRAQSAKLRWAVRAAPAPSDGEPGARGGEDQP